MSNGGNLIVKRIGTYDLTGSRLGKGNFAFVELAINRITKSKVAVKVIDTRKIKDEYVKRNILREAFILKKIQHPNVVKLYETLKQRGVYCLVTEYVAGGELLGFIRCQPESRLSESQSKPIVRQIASALHHLHERGIIHRDLKMENILLDETKKNIKIVDFGLSNICKHGEFLKTQCGSPEYAAPELFKKDCKYSTEVDLWSLGVITFGMLVGKLPFRTMHSGIRGRNDLVDQMSRGLNSIHGKYLSFLSAECQDFLKRLLEPNSYIRLRLEELMLHPWITTKGSWPLVPYSPPDIDEETTEKVFSQVSELIKMPKSKLKIHMLRNRYDTISGIYHLMLDGYLHRETESDKAINKDRQDRHILWNPKNNQDRESIARDRKSISHRSPDGVIKVCIKQAFHSPAEQGEGDNENNEIKSDEKENKERMILKPVSGNDLLDRTGGIDSLRIRGMRLSPSNTRDKRQIRPYTTDLTSNHRYRKNSVTPVPRPQSMNVKLSRDESRTESCTKAPSQSQPHSVDIKFEPDDSNTEPRKKTTGKIILTSPRKEKEIKNAEEPMAKIKDVADTSMIDETKKEEASVGAPEEKDEDKTENAPLECLQEGVQDAGGAVAKIEPLHNGISSVTVIARSNELQRRPLKSPRQLRCGPKKKPYFINSPDITSAHGFAASKDQSQRHFSTRGNSARSRGQSEKDFMVQVQKIDNGKEKITNSLNAIYQGYVKKCKPHHRKLSIMQAHEILQRESKFQSKYGRRPDSSKLEKESTTEEKTDEKTPSVEVTTFEGAKIVRREKKAQKYFKSSGISGLTLKEDHKDLYLHATQCRWMKNEILESGLLKEREHTSKNPEEKKRSASASSDAKGDKVIVTQEESLKRQKQKELTEEVEREKQRIERELLDSERVKLIEQYLDDVYTRYAGVNTTTLQLDNKAVEKERLSHSKIPKHQGQIYSWLPRKKTQRSFSPGVSSKTPSILNSSNQTSQTFSMRHMAKKVDFKEKQPSDAQNNKVRYFNDWNKTAFINYVNSEGEFKVDEANQDLANKLKDGGYWLKRHLSGVVIKANTKNVGAGPASKT